jgi:hypothetical protein
LSHSVVQQYESALHTSAAQALQLVVSFAPDEHTECLHVLPPPPPPPPLLLLLLLPLPPLLLLPPPPVHDWPQ